MLPRHLFQDRELFTLEQCLPKQSTATPHQDTQQEQCYPAIYLQDASGQGSGPGATGAPFQSYLYFWEFPSLYPQWLSFKGSLQEQGRDRFKFVTAACCQSWTKGSPCSFWETCRVGGHGRNHRLPMCFHSCAECYPFNQLLSDNSWVPGLQLAACKLCCATVSAGQMCLDITVSEYIFSECSWAVFWRAAQHASRFRSNKREKWGALAMPTETSMNGQILSMRKEKKTQAFGLNQCVSIGSSLHRCLLSPVYFDLQKGFEEQKALTQTKSPWSLVQAWQQAEPLISGWPFVRVREEVQAESGKCRCSFLPVTSQELMSRRGKLSSLSKGLQGLVFPSYQLEKGRPVPERKGSDKMGSVCVWMNGR